MATILVRARGATAEASVIEHHVPRRRGQFAGTARNADGEYTAVVASDSVLGEAARKNVDPKIPDDLLHESRRGAALRRAGCWLVIGVLLGAAITMAILRWRFADPTPALTEESFRAARQQWAQRGPQDYDVEVVVQGPQPGTYRVTVRGGASIAALRNGQPLAQQRTFGTWSVPGMFGTISRDLAQIERRRTGNADRLTPDLTLRASFDPELGYPRHYLRMEAGSTQDVSWTVTKFVAR